MANILPANWTTTNFNNGDTLLIGNPQDVWNPQSANQTWSFTNPGGDNNTCRYEVRQGDVANLGGGVFDPSYKNRSEVNGHGHQAEYLNSPTGHIYITYDFVLLPGQANDAEFFVIGQFHQVANDGNSPPFEIDLYYNFTGSQGAIGPTDCMSFSIGSGSSSSSISYNTVYHDPINPYTPLVRGRTYSMYIDINFDNTSNGSLFVTRDDHQGGGPQTLVNYSGPVGWGSTMQGVYWKNGIYRGNHSGVAAPATTQAVTYSNFSISQTKPSSNYSWLNGATFNDVGIAFTVENASQTWSMTTSSSSSTNPIRFEVRSGDNWPTDNDTTKERSEIDGGNSALNSPIQYYVKYDLMVESGTASTSSYCVIGQFHQTVQNGYSPPYEMDLINNDRMTVYLNNANNTDPQIWQDTNPIVRGQTYHMEVDIGFDNTNGWLKVYRDSNLLVNYTGPVGWSGMGGVYWKNGIYRHASSYAIAVNYSNLSISNTAPPPPGTTSWLNGQIFNADNIAFTVENASQTWSMTTPTATNNNQVRFEVHSGDNWPNENDTTKERSEIDEGGDITYPTPVHLNVKYQFMVEPGTASTSSYCVIGQIHHTIQNSFSPPFEMDLIGGDLMSVYINNSNNTDPLIWQDSTPITRGHWYNMEIYTYFNDTSGFVQIWRDNKQILNYTGPVGWASAGTMGNIYWKNGVYRHASSYPIAVNYSNLQITTGAAQRLTSTGSIVTKTRGNFAALSNFKALLSTARSITKLRSSISTTINNIINNSNTTLYVWGSGSGYWTVPTGVTSINVQCWGAGGSSAATSDGGAGGGAYASSQLSVTPGATYQFQVGAPVAGGNGGATWFSSSGTLNAPGGHGTTTTSGGAGGSGATGTTIYNGGSGATAAQGGGGGGSAGPDGAGNSSTTSAGGSGDAGAVPGGTSGTSGNSNFPLGGGGGGFNANGGFPGGGGGAGQTGRIGLIIITYPSALPSYQALIFSNSNTTWYPWGYSSGNLQAGGPSLSNYNISVQCWGAGGGGAGYGAGYLNGGGGGAYASNIYNINSNGIINYQLGTGGAGATGSAFGGTGGSTWFGSTSTVLAAGGSGNGTGGLASSSVGLVTYSGGNDTGEFHYGGGSAGPDGIGGDAYGYSNGGAGDNGNGGGGATGTVGNPGGNDTLGGGGGGAISSGTAGAGGYPGGGGGAPTVSGTGGVGGNGQILITLTYIGLSSIVKNIYRSAAKPLYSALVKARVAPRVLSISQASGKSQLIGKEFSFSSVRSSPKPIVPLSGNFFPITALSSPPPTGKTSISGKSTSNLTSNPKIGGTGNLRGSVLSQSELKSSAKYNYPISTSRALSNTALYTTLIPTSYLKVRSLSITSQKSSPNYKSSLLGKLFSRNVAVNSPKYKAIISATTNSVSSVANNFFGSLKLVSIAGSQISKLAGTAVAGVSAPLAGLVNSITNSTNLQAYIQNILGSINSISNISFSPSNRTTSLFATIINNLTTKSVTSGTTPLSGLVSTASSAPQNPLISLLLSGATSSIYVAQGIFTKFKLFSATALSKAQQGAISVSANAALYASLLSVTSKSFSGGSFSLQLLAQTFSKSVSSITRYATALSAIAFYKSTQNLQVQASNITAKMGGVVNSVLTAPQSPFISRPLSGLGQFVTKVVGPSNNNLNFIFLPSKILSIARALTKVPAANAAMNANFSSLANSKTNGAFKIPLSGKSRLKTAIKTLQPSTINLLKIAARILAIPMRSRSQQTYTAGMSANTRTSVTYSATNNFVTTFLSGFGTFTTGLGSFITLPPAFLAASAFSFVSGILIDFVPRLKINASTASSNSSAYTNPSYFALLKTKSNSSTTSKISMANNLAHMMSNAFTNFTTKSPFKLITPLAGRVAQGVLRFGSPPYIHGIGLRAAIKFTSRIVLNNGLTSNTGILLKAITSSYTKSPSSVALTSFLRGVVSNKSGSRNSVSGKGKLYGSITSINNSITRFIGIAKIVSRIRTISKGRSILGGILSLPISLVQSKTFNKAGAFKFRVGFVANLISSTHSTNILRSTQFIFGKAKSITQNWAVSPLSVFMRAIGRSKMTSRPPVVGNTLLIVKTETLLAAKAQATPHALLKARTSSTSKGSPLFGGIANLFGAFNVASTTVSDIFRRIWDALTSEVSNTQDKTAFTFPLNIHEQGTSRDSNLGVHVYNVTTNEVSSASDIILGRLRTVLSTIEAGSSGDTVLNIERIITQLTEAGIASAVELAVNSVDPHVQDFGVASDAPSTLQKIAALLGESGTATDVVSRNILEQCLENGLAEDIVSLLLYAFDPLYYILSQPRVYEVTQAYPGPREALAQPFKDPSERLNIIFNFKNSLASFESIGSINSITVQAYYGTDANPSAMLLGSPLILSSNSVQQTVIGGLNGVTYKVKMLINSSLGQVLCLTATIPVATQ